MLEPATIKPVVSTVLAEAKASARSKVSNGKMLFLERDGHSRASPRFRDITAAISADLGGADRLSEGQRQLIRRCAMLSVQCEQMEARGVAGGDVDLDLCGTMTDRLGRALQQLGLKRVPRDATPDLRDYLSDPRRRPIGPVDEASGR